MLTIVARAPVTMATAKFNTNKRRAFEKKRVQTLKSWHEDVKKIAKSEVDFIKSIFQDDKDSEDRDWVRDDETDEEPPKDRSVVKTDV